jgi:hypothetical protein
MARQCVLGCSRHLDLHDLFFFGGERRIDIGHVLVGELLHLRFRAPLVVLWEISFSFRSSLMSFITSRRTLRTATRAPSASWRSIFVISRRRSSVSAGIGTRITVPAVMGVSPRSDLKMAFSMACTTFFSHGEMTSVRPSSTAMLATCCSGTSEP